MSKRQTTAARTAPARAVRVDRIEREIVQLIAAASEKDGVTPQAILSRVAHRYGLIVSLGTGPELTTYTA